MKKGAKKYVPILFGAVIFLLTAGVTWAIYEYSGTGGTNTITTGTVSMSYAESSNIIEIGDAFPTHDENGMESDDYFDFSITSNANLGVNDGDLVMPYEISLEPLSVEDGYTALTDYDVKVYLTTVEGTTETEVYAPRLIGSLGVSSYNENNYFLYYKKHVHTYGTNTITTNYRLRAWIDFDVNNSEWQTERYEYKFRVNVNSDTNFVGYITPEYCFDYTNDGTNSTITGYNCYAGNEEEMAFLDTTSNVKLMANRYEAYPVYTDVVIPNTLGGYPVTMITGGSFSGKGITSVVFPDSLIDIGASSFNNNYLTSIIIPDNVVSVGVASFMSNRITDVVIGDSVETIGQVAFWQGNRIKSLTLGNSVTLIDYNAFANNELTSVTIPDSVITIGGGAFSNGKIINLTLGSSLKTINWNSFMYNKITSLIIPASVTTIGREAFAYNNLSTIVIESGSQLTADSGIENKAFYANNTIENGYVCNPNLHTIYNNSGKAFRWDDIITSTSIFEYPDYTKILCEVPSQTISENITTPLVHVISGTP